MNHPPDLTEPHRRRPLRAAGQTIVGMLALAVLLVSAFGWLGWILQPEPPQKPATHTTTGDPR